MPERPTAAAAPAPASIDPGRVLIVDDEESVGEVLAVVLAKEGYEVERAANGESGLACFRARKPDVVLQDLRMPDCDGITMLRRYREADPNALVIMITAFGSWEAAVDAMRLGAFDFIRKPFDNRDVRASVARAVLLGRTRGSAGGGLGAARSMVGSSPAIQQIFDLIRRIASTDATVLIQGESGTGKELVARALHLGSPRAAEPFIPVNCGAFTESLLESELFGHMRGAFTGAVADKRGLIELADRGTFFLDEVGEMSPALQVKLLRVLEERELKRVGGTENTRVDIRFITATNRDLEEEVRRQTFREDLFYRLNVITLRLPPLRERKEDIPLLAGHFLAKFGRALRKDVNRFTPDAMAALLAYDWPGNIRELENSVQRAVALVEKNEIGVEDLVDKVRSAPARVAAPAIPPEGVSLDQKLEEVERAYLGQALQLSGGNLTKAAELLKLTFRSLRYRVKKLGIAKELFRPEELEDDPGS
ncbi:MAG: sigma-54-dependent Fis family transcriptional regulator [Planctomycetes bacterium]|nr:sigma-54-dependent Fis family transcriptional regulator [Planctomycetota bacterium]